MHALKPIILIVEDEPDLAAPLAFTLEQNGFHPVCAANGTEAMDRLGQSPRPAAILLDLMLPDFPGTELLRRIQAEPQTSDIPVIMVTARNEEIDIVVGLELGAADYITKPYSNRELLLRLRNVLRRHPVRDTALAPSEPPSLIQVDGLRLDTAAHQAWVHDTEIALTALEFKLLTVMVQRRGRVLSRETLLERVWPPNVQVTERTVDTHVKRMRHKLGPLSAFVQTVRGVGYRFARMEGRG